MDFKFEENLQRLFITGTLLSQTLIFHCQFFLSIYEKLKIRQDSIFTLNQEERLKVLLLLGITLLVDFIWLVFWGPKWTSDSQYGQWESGTHKIVLACACFIFIVKICIIIIGCYTEKKSIQDKVNLIKKQGSENQFGQASVYGNQTPYRQTQSQYGQYPSQSPMRPGQQNLY